MAKANEVERKWYVIDAEGKGEKKESPQDYYPCAKVFLQAQHFFQV